MREVLIVSRTKMRNGVCVGGIDIALGSFVRLQTESGTNLSCDAPYYIGEIWNLELESPWNPRKAPHIEDVMVKFATRLGVVASEQLSSYIELTLNITETNLKSNMQNKKYWILFGFCTVYVRFMT